MTTVESRPTTGRVTTPAALGALTLWFAAAVAAGGSGILKSLPVPLPVIAALISLCAGGVHLRHKAAAGVGAGPGESAGWSPCISFVSSE